MRLLAEPVVIFALDNVIDLTGPSSAVHGDDLIISLPQGVFVQPTMGRVLL